MEQKKNETNRKKISLSKSIKFSILVTFFYSLIVYNDYCNEIGLFNGGINDFGGLGSLFIIAFIITPFIVITFGKNIILYNFFYYFKSKKKLIAFFIGVIILEFGILYFIETPSIKHYEIKLKNQFFNQFYCKDLPNEFAAYKSLNKNSVFKNGVKMNLVINSINTIKYNIINQNNLIIETGNDTLKKLYKLNNFGIITDQFDIIDVYNEQFLIGYLLNIEEDYYRTWGLNGDKTKKKIEIENEKLSWNQAVQKNFLVKIIKKNNFYFSAQMNSNISDVNKNRLDDYHRIFYLENGNWKYFYSNLNKSNYFDFEFLEKISFPTLETQTMKYYSNIFYHYFKPEKDDPELVDEYIDTEIPNINKNIQYRYFQNLNRDGDLIKGNLYYDLIVGKDTLKLKEYFELNVQIDKYAIIIDNNIVGYSKVNPFYYYTNNKLNFQLFTNDLTMLYVITKNK